jgi:hypothetical protein
MTDSLPAMGIQLALIVADDDLQPRVKTDHHISQEYGLAMAKGDQFPPLDVFWDGETYWLAGGFHRYHAASAIGLPFIDCFVHEGSRDDALWFTCGTNAKHGVRRSRDDIRLVIERALLHPQGAGRTDREIAAMITCSHHTVAAVRAHLVSVGQIAQQNERVGKDGKTYRADADRGKAREEDAEPAAEAAVELAAEAVQMDIEDVPGVKPDPKVAPLIDPAFAHLPEHLRAIVRAHSALPSAGVTAANFPEVLAHALTIEDVEAIAAWWVGFLPLWRARQPAIQRYQDRIRAVRAIN